MNKFSVILILTLNLYFTNFYAQESSDSTALKINFKWKNENLQLGKKYNTTTDTLQINVFKFYISNLEIHYKDNTFFKSDNQYYLIDIEKSNSVAIPRSAKSISKLIFTIGVDSLASVSGAASGSLDVTNGMYWAWQSGFINMKIEGESSSCKD